MKKINKLFVSLLCITLMFGVTACDDDDYDTNQIGKGTSLSSFGPNPVARGGELRFVGANLNNIKQVEIPGCSAITTIKVITSGSPSEIRVTVPKDGSEVGYVTLTANDGTKITTQTELTYTEPIALDSFSPSSIFPGEVLTIEGDYLNLIHEILFSTLETEVYFSVADSFFITHERYSITLEVPEEAVSGKIIISDADEDAPNWIYSEENLEVKTASAEKVESSTFKAGDQMTISGTRLDLVEYVRFYNAEGEAIDVAEKSEEEDGFTYSDGVITLAQPTEAASGTIALVMRSEVEVVAMEDFVAVLPSSAEVTSKLIKNGETIDIEGENLDLVRGVAFYTIDYNYTYGTFSVKDGVISVTIPTDAIDGDIILFVASGESYTISNVELAKPAISSFTTIQSVEPTRALSAGNGVTAGDEVIITGDNIDLIDKISIGGGGYSDVTLESGDYVTTLALDSKSGEINYILKNGADYTDENETIDITAIEYCYIRLGNEPTVMYYDNISNFPVNNGSNLAKVTFVYTVEKEGNDEDEEVEYEDVEVEVSLMLNKDTMLYVAVPSMADLGYSSSGKLKLTSTDNNVVSYDVTFDIKAEEETIWKDKDGFDLGNWSGMSDLSWGGYDWSTVAAGTKITVYYTIDTDQGWWQLRFGNGSWAALPGTSDVIELDKESSSYSIILTKDMIDELNSAGGLVLTGCYIIITEVTLAY